MTAVGFGVIATAGDIAQVVSGRLEGPADLAISGLAPFDKAAETDLVFVRDERHASRWPACGARVALVTDGLTLAGHDSGTRSAIFVADADLAMIALLRQAHAKLEPPVELGIHATAVVAPEATLEGGVSIGPHVFIESGAHIGEGCRIGAGCMIGHGVTLGPGVVLADHVTLLRGVEIGAGSIMHTGVIIGTDGFGYRPSPDGRGVIKVPHIGGVVIGAGVEIGANSCVDRGMFGNTRIGDGTKIDNLVQIGHNCDIGRSVIICGCSAIGGSTRIEDGALLGGKVGVPDNVTIGAGAKIAGGSLLSGSVPAGESYSGVPARPSSQYKRDFGAVRRIHRIKSAIENLRERLEKLERPRGAGEKDAP